MALAAWNQPAAEPHQGAYVPVDTDGGLALWKLDEGNASDDFTDSILAGSIDRKLTISGLMVTTDALYGARQLSIGSGFYQGARIFTGSTYARASAGVGTDVAVFQTVEAEGFSAAGWFRPSTLSATQFLIGYCGDSFAGGTSDNMQFGVRVDSSGQIFTRWTNAGGSVDAVCTARPIAAAETVHWGVAVERDPKRFGVFRARFYVNGLCVQIIENLEPAIGGANARWFMGARPSTTTPGTYLEFVNGIMDDISVLAFAASTEWFRRQYARGLQDFQLLTPYVPQGRRSLAEEYEVHTRVLVEDRFSGVWEPGQRDAEGFVDVTALFGWNWLLSVDIDESSDRQSDTADIELVTRIGEMSMSPEAVPNGQAFYFNALNTGASSLLTECNRVKVEVAIVPYGCGRAGAFPHWALRFDGFIASVEAGDQSTRVRCTDRMGPLQDVWVEPNPETGVDWSYGSLPVGTPIEAVLQKLVNDNDPGRYPIVSVNDDGGSLRIRAHVFRTTSKPEPGRPHLFQGGDEARITGTTNFNVVSTVLAVTEAYVTLSASTLSNQTLEIAGLLEAVPSQQGYIGGKPWLYTPTSPLFEMFPFNVPSSAPVSTWLEQIASQIGYAVRFAWDDDRQAYRLALSRFEQLDIFELTLRRVLDVSGQGRNKESARNVLVGEYGEALDSDNTGNPRRRIVAETRGDTRMRFGRRYARIGLSSLDLVNTASEVEEMLETMIRDLNSSQNDATIELLYSPRVVVNGGVSVQSEFAEVAVIPRAFPLGRTLYITAVRTRLDSRGGRQTITVRSATGGVSRTQAKYAEMFQQRGYVKAAALAAPSTTGVTGALYGISLGGSVRGLHVSWTFPPARQGAAWDFVEVHVSATLGFSPSSSTLRTTVRGTSTVVAGLTASTTYYVMLVLRDRMNNESAPIDLGSVATPA